MSVVRWLRGGRGAAADEGSGSLVRRRGAAAVGLALALAMAGCATDGDGDAVPTPTVTTADTSKDPTPEPTTDTPTPEHTPWPEPTRPAEMDRDDIEGAKAAAVYFMELYQYVYATGDAEEWQAMSHRECQFCAGALDHVNELYGSGGYSEGGRFEVQDVGAREPNDEYPHYRVGVSGEEQASVEYAEDGEVVRTVDGGTLRYNFALLHEEGHWVVRAVAVDQKDPA